MPRGGRRDSLSPDSAAEESSRKGRRDSSFGASSDKVCIPYTIPVELNACWYRKPEHLFKTLNTNFLSISYHFLLMALLYTVVYV